MKCALKTVLISMTRITETRFVATTDEHTLLLGKFPEII